MRFFRPFSSLDTSDGWILFLTVTGRRGWILYHKIQLKSFRKKTALLLFLTTSSEMRQEVLCWHNGATSGRDCSLVPTGHGRPLHGNRQVGPHLQLRPPGRTASNGPWTCAWASQSPPTCAAGTVRGPASRPLGGRNVSHQARGRAHLHDGVVRGSRTSPALPFFGGGGLSVLHPRP